MKEAANYSGETFLHKRRFTSQSGASLMPTAEDYKRSADECRRVAEQVQDSIERETILKMAEQWDRLARSKAQIEAAKKDEAAS